MERGRDSREVALGSLGALYVDGFGLDHARRCSRPRLSVPLPTYAWHRKRYWMAGARPGGPSAKAEERALGGYAMLGRKFVSLRASGERYFEVEMGPQDHPELFRDRIEGVPLLPLSTAVELALASARHEMGGTSFVVRDFSTPNDIVLPDDEGVTMQLVMAPDDDGDYKIELFAARSDQRTTPLASAWVVPDGPEKPEKLPEARKPDWTEKPHWTEKAPSDIEPPRQVKARLDEIALLDRPTTPGNGPPSSVERVWTGPGEALAMIRSGDEAPSRGTYIANPALLTRALELLGIAAGAGGDLVLSGFRRLRVKRSFGDTIWAHARVVPSGPTRCQENCGSGTVPRSCWPNSMEPNCGPATPVLFGSRCATIWRASCTVPSGRRRRLRPTCSPPRPRYGTKVRGLGSFMGAKVAWSTSSPRRWHSKGTTSS